MCFVSSSCGVGKEEERRRGGGAEWNVVLPQTKLFGHKLLQGTTTKAIRGERGREREETDERTNGQTDRPLHKRERYFVCTYTLQLCAHFHAKFILSQGSERRIGDANWVEIAGIPISLSLSSLFNAFLGRGITIAKHIRNLPLHCTRQQRAFWYILCTGWSRAEHHLFFCTNWFSEAFFPFNSAPPRPVQDGSASLLLQWPNYNHGKPINNFSLRPLYLLRRQCCC